MDPLFQGKGIGSLLIDAIKKQAMSLEYSELYLLSFDPNIPMWYNQLGWEIIGMDTLFNHPIIYKGFS